MRPLVITAVYARTVVAVFLASQENTTSVEWPHMQWPQAQVPTWPQWQWPQNSPPAPAKSERALGVSSVAIKTTHSTVVVQDSESSQSLQKWTATFKKQGEIMPLTDTSISKAADPGFVTNRYRLHRALNKFLSGGHLHVVVVGGSFTAKGGPACPKSWPHRLEALLQDTAREFGNGASVTVDNLASPATMTSYIAARFSHKKASFEKADIVISEYNINDVQQYRVSRTGRQQSEMYNKMFYHQVQMLPNKPAFVYYDLATINGSDASWNSAHQSFAASVRAPLVWFLDAVKHTGRTYLEPAASAASWVSSGDSAIDAIQRSHPACMPSHDTVALLMFKVLERDMQYVRQRGVLGADGPLIALSAAEEEQVLCMAEPTFHASAAKSGERVPLELHTLEADGWYFGEDRKGKPGWIARASGAPATLVVELTLRRGVVFIEALHSYEQLGDMRCSLEQDSVEVGAVQIRGIWKEHVSETDVAVLRAEKRGRGDDSEAQTYHLRCSTNGGKAKITAVTAC